MLLWNPFRLKPKPEHTGPHYGGYYERMAAAAIDLFVMFTIFNQPFQHLQAMLYPYYASFVQPEIVANIHAETAGLGTFAQLALFISRMFEAGIAQWYILSNTLSVVILIFAMALSLHFFRTTPGKWLLGLKITRTDDITRPGFWRLVWRYTACAIGCIPLMLGFIWMMFDKKSRGWHDFAAGTHVQNLRPTGWYWGHIKRGYRRLRNQISPASAAAAEQPVAQPPSEERK